MTVAAATRTTSCRVNVSCAAYFPSLSLRVANVCASATRVRGNCQCAARAAHHCAIPHTQPVGGHASRLYASVLARTGPTDRPSPPPTFDCQARFLFAWKEPFVGGWSSTPHGAAAPTMTRAFSLSRFGRESPARPFISCSLSDSWGKIRFSSACRRRRRRALLSPSRHRLRF